MAVSLFAIVHSRFATGFALGSLALAGCSRGGSTSYRAEPVTRGAITEVVSATGDVSAIVTVNIGSQVSGTISKLYVDFNSQVKKGQPLAELDPRLFRAALERAQAGLASSQAAVEKAPGALDDGGGGEKGNQEAAGARRGSPTDG